jgi:lipopolysaccharide transport system ATP-binding protein
VKRGPVATEAQPTIFHVTHQKAGSQWLHKIFLECAPGRIVTPQVKDVQFLQTPLQAGKVYPTVYITKEEFESVVLPANWRRFVVIRDLRDTMVSAYFSMKVSHPVSADLITELRTRLQSISMEDGLMFILEQWLPRCAAIQMSWWRAGERLIRYEDLLTNDVEILETLLIDEGQLPISRQQLRKIVEKNRFEKVTGGRSRGQEDVASHERKGIAGDWQNFFTDAIKQRFKERYGEVLITTGYEEGLDW